MRFTIRTNLVPWLIMLFYGQVNSRAALAYLDVFVFNWQLLVKILFLSVQNCLFLALLDKN